MTTQKEKDSHKTWKNDILSVEAIIDESLWNKQVINDFQKNLNQILIGVCQKSDLINTNKKNYKLLRKVEEDVYEGQNGKRYSLKGSNELVELEEDNYV